MIETEAKLNKSGGCLGWLAIGSALFGWFKYDDLTVSRWPESRLYEYFTVGLFGAIVVGLGLRAVRVSRPRLLGWVAVGLGGALVVRAAHHIARWL
jgi:hypothetical protein